MNRQTELLFIAGVGALIFMLTFGVYFQTRNFNFVNYDDSMYVYKSETVTNGLTRANMVWAFSNVGRDATCNWHPVTTLSFMADVSLFGLNPGAMHVHNAVLHALNSVLVFLLLLMLCKRLFCLEDVYDTGKQESEDRPHFSIFLVIAAASAAVFWSLHPLRAESVAWISSRKDVLSMFFYLLGMMVYLKERGSEKGFLLSLAAYIFAYMSKPTAIVFPATLFLTEYMFTRKIAWKRIAIFGVFSVFFASLTVIAQEEAQSAVFPLWLRIQNMIASVGDYFRSTVWPMKLSPFYPYDEVVPSSRLIPGFVLCVIVALFIFEPFLRRLFKDLKNTKEHGESAQRHDKRSSTPLFEGMTLGTLWFFLCIIPVIGIVQVGVASHADRYTYLPGIGFSIVLASLFYACFARLKKRRIYLLLAYSIVFTGLCIYARAGYGQIKRWSDTITLFSRTCDEDPDNYVAYCNVAAEYYERGEYEMAFKYVRRMAASRDVDFGSRRIGLVLYKLLGGVEDGQTDVDVIQYILSSQISLDDPLAADKYYAMAYVACGQKLYASAYSSIMKSIELKPEDAFSWTLLSQIHFKQNNFDEALKVMRKADALFPKNTAILRAIEGISKIIEIKRKQGKEDFGKAEEQTTW